MKKSKKTMLREIDKLNKEYNLTHITPKRQIKSFLLALELYEQGLSYKDIDAK